MATERLRLRELEIEDLDPLFEVLGDPVGFHRVQPVFAQTSSTDVIVRDQSSVRFRHCPLRTLIDLKPYKSFGDRDKWPAGRELY